TGSSDSVISSSNVSLPFPFLLYVSSVLFFNSSNNVVSSFSSHNSLIILSISSKTGSISSSVLLHNSVTSFPDSLLPKSSVSTLILISFPEPVTLKIPSLFTYILIILSFSFLLFLLSSSPDSYHISFFQLTKLVYILSLLFLFLYVLSH